MKIRKEYSIALLVLGSVALLIFGINFLKGLDLLQKRNIFHVVYNDVSGITGASPIFYNGFKVGQVIGSELMPDGSGRIAVRFQLDEDELILTKDTKVEIYSSDLFSRALRILPGGGPAAETGDTLIGDAQLSLTDAVGQQIDPLKRKAEGMLASIDSVLSSLQLVLNDTAVGDIHASFASIRGTLETLNTTTHRMDELMATETTAIHAIIENLRSVSNNLAGMNDELTHVVQNMDSATAVLADGKLKKMIADLSESGAQLKTIMTGLEQGEGTLGALLKNDTLYTNLEKSSKELDLLLEDFRLNPNRYVHVSVFGKKDKLPKLSGSDIDRIGKAVQEQQKK
ncbi:MAG: MlaD family protein [Flavobacteriales bacterium]